MIRICIISTRVSTDSFIFAIVFLYPLLSSYNTDLCTRYFFVITFKTNFLRFFLCLHQEKVFLSLIRLLDIVFRAMCCICGVYVFFFFGVKVCEKMCLFVFNQLVTTQWLIGIRLKQLISTKSSTHWRRVLLGEEQ